jgi:hypothetical protein
VNAQWTLEQLDTNVVRLVSPDGREVARGSKQAMEALRRHEERDAKVIFRLSQDRKAEMVKIAQANGWTQQELFEQAMSIMFANCGRQW